MWVGSGVPRLAFGFDCLVDIYTGRLVQGRRGFFGDGGVGMVGVVGSLSPLRRGGCAAVCWVFDRESRQRFRFC